MNNFHGQHHCHNNNDRRLAVGRPSSAIQSFFRIVFQCFLLHNLSGAGGTVGVGGNDDGHAVSTLHLLTKSWAGW